jgi:hypothetical protein
LFLPARYTSTVRSAATNWLVFIASLFFAVINRSSSLEQAVKLIIIPAVRMLMSIVLTKHFFVAMIPNFLIVLLQN